MVETFHLVEFDGQTIVATVTNKSWVAEFWLQKTIKLSSQIGPKRIVGMGCKYVRHPINSMSGKIAILQLCVGKRCLVLQLLNINFIPRSLVDFLNDSRNAFVGVGIIGESRKLVDEYALDVKCKVDLHFLAKNWFPGRYTIKERPSLRDMAFRVAGMRSRRRHGICKDRDWESGALTMN